MSFDIADPNEFTLLPSNARLQAGAPPLGTPNYFASTFEFLNAQEVYKFHVDWNSITLSTLTGVFNPLASSSWPNQAPGNAATPGNPLDVIPIRAMVQNQYTNIGGVESLWVCHTVERGTVPGGNAHPRWYQIPVTGGTVGPNDIQSTTWDPDGANTSYRYVPSLAVDRAGNMALGYSKSNSTTNPQIKYAGRLAGDPINTFSQTEQTLFDGTGTQTGNCGGSTCTRWGDYTAMTLDPDGCTFWYTNEYYAVNGLNDLTRIGAFKYPSCTPVGGGGTVQGTVTTSPGGAPIGGATIQFGARTATTNGSGVYQFLNIPAGTYPSITASFPGRNPSTATSIVVTDGGTTTKDFALTVAPSSACLTDTTQADFQMGFPKNVDLTTSPGNVILDNTPNIDQQNPDVSASGFGFARTDWAGQTFTPAVSGPLTRVDLDLFCSLCSGINPDITVSIRATTGSPAVPTGSDLAVTTVPGFSFPGAIYYFAHFASPATLTAGTRYAVIFRLVSDRTAGTQSYVISTANPYANGQRVTSTDSGATWFVDTVAGGRDLGFNTYIGYASHGDFTSSQKDANPAAGLTPTWTTLSWTNPALPAGTQFGFQVAASNGQFGPFNFVGPDGTAGTFFTTSGASLAQFNGNRYLRYKAYFATADGLQHAHLERCHSLLQ